MCIRDSNYPNVVVQQNPFTNRHQHTSLVFDNKLWIFGGTDNTIRFNDIWWSENGADWTKEVNSKLLYPKKRLHSSVVFDDRMWIIGGYGDDGQSNDVWSSEDGMVWEEATPNANFTPRNSHASVVFDNKLWVIGGYDGTYRSDVWYSQDGINWTQATSDGGFAPRGMHAAVVMDGKIWVIGGNNTDGILDDVYYSVDGTIWVFYSSGTDVEGFPAVTSFPLLYGHTALAYGGKLWVIAGHTEGVGLDGYSNDVWYNDGTDPNWKELEPGPLTFPSRAGHTSLVFGHAVWILGGMNDNGVFNSVWNLD